jgi:hypothetical protein
MGNCICGGAIGGAGDVGGVLSRVLCGCVGDENGVGASELSVDTVDADDDGNDAGRKVNCPRRFLRGVEASVNVEETAFLRI